MTLLSYTDIYWIYGTIYLMMYVALVIYIFFIKKEFYTVILGSFELLSLQVYFTIFYTEICFCMTMLVITWCLEIFLLFGNKFTVFCSVVFLFILYNQISS